MAIINRDVFHDYLYHSINSRLIYEISQELEQYCLSELLDRRPDGCMKWWKNLQVPLTAMGKNTTITFCIV